MPTERKIAIVNGASQGTGTAALYGDQAIPRRAVKRVHVRAHRMACDSDEKESIDALIDVTATRAAQKAVAMAQAQLAHASRVAMLGEMSASIAHEINQPLAAIVASGQAARRWLERPTPEIGEVLASIQRIIDAADRATRLTQHIRALARKSEPETSSLDLNGVVDEALVLVQREALSHQIPLHRELASGLPPVRGNGTQLQQVVTNLVLNGLQATAARERTSAVVVRTSRFDAARLLLAVEDAGVGAEPENLDQLFSPFYTTRPDGMGMGLAICRSIVDAHGGELRAVRNAGSGMTFEFTIPVAGEAARMC
jgi:C4-dicarboxylate-specific signal transduction histidine kinase